MKRCMLSADPWNISLSVLKLGLQCSQSLKAGNEGKMKVNSKKKFSNKYLLSSKESTTPLICIILNGQFNRKEERNVISKMILCSAFLKESVNGTGCWHMRPVWGGCGGEAALSSRWSVSVGVWGGLSGQSFVLYHGAVGVGVGFRTVILSCHFVPRSKATQIR